MNPRKIIVAALFILIPYLIIQGLVLKLLPHFYWAESFQVASIWFKSIQLETLSFFAFFFVAYVLLRSQFAVALSLAQKTKQDPIPSIISKPLGIIFDLFKAYQQFLSDSSLVRWSTKVLALISELLIFFLSFSLAWQAKNWWLSIQMALNAVPFGSKDPLFNQDISFYLLQFPLIIDLLAWFSFVIFLALGISTWVYFSKGALLKLFISKQRFTPKKHLAFLLSLLILGMAAQYFLNKYSILFSARGSVFGAGYTDFNVMLIFYKIQFLALVALALTVLLGGFLPVRRILYICLAICILNPIITGTLAPNFIQNFIVEPNELNKERPFINHNIALTRQAYGLDKVKEVNYDVSTQLTANDIQKNSSLLKNIRLWNEEPLKQTFKQLQEIRLYYEFNDIDVDRYRINGDLQQVMLSARELDINQLSEKANTWLNNHLIYTHGFGLCLSPVNDKSKEGLPKFYIKDFPPQSIPDIPVKQAEIYFGESTNNYVVVNTKQPEFNYPQGNKNIENHYEGRGGILLDSAFKRAALSYHLSDIKLLISNYIKNDSKLLFDRNIMQIVKKATPFIAFDQDPYLVISKKGRLFWMIDGYTLSKYFPYAERFQKSFNYIRNSVVVTIDAYNGDLNYYVKDENEAILKTLAKIFPNIFKPLASLPSDLLEHIRYPKDLFDVQSKMFQTYHMTQAQIFYNREDLWQIPNETYGETEQQMKPYYIVSRYPKEAKDSFSLILPFTPAKKNNMISLLRAKSDPEAFGELVVYKFPKERTIYGPMQIESRIDQDTEISQKLTLWGQKGSRVIRGNLVVMPVEETLLYVEPIYLQATQSQLPELKRIIFSHHDQIVMSDTLNQGINALVSNNVIEKLSESPKETKQGNSLREQLIQQTLKLKEFLKKALESLDENIETLKKVSNNNPNGG